MLLMRQTGCDRDNEVAHSNFSRKSKLVDPRTNQLVENRPCSWFAYLFDREVLKDRVDF
jgi:hypothetical protein